MITHWKQDDTGDTLWAQEEYLGCIYDRDGLAGSVTRHGWRALDVDFRLVGDVIPTNWQPVARLGARLLLESHCGSLRGPLPSAATLLAST